MGLQHQTPALPASRKADYLIGLKMNQLGPIGPRALPRPTVDLQGPSGPSCALGVTPAGWGWGDRSRPGGERLQKGRWAVLGEVPLAAAVLPGGLGTEEGVVTNRERGAC